MTIWRRRIRSLLGLSKKSAQPISHLPVQDSIIELIPDIIVQADLDKRYTWTNQPGYDFFGKDVLGKDLNFFSVEKIDLKKVLDPLYKGKEDTIIAENWQRRIDGNRRLLLWRVKAIFNDQGKIIGTISMGRDITGEKNNEFNLLERTIEIESFFTYSQELLCIVNTKGLFLRLSLHWENVLGYPIKELLGQKYIDFVHPDDIESTLLMSSIVSKQKKVKNYRNRYRHKDGSYRWIEWNSFSIGETVYASARDITEQLLIQEAIKNSEARYRNLVENSPIINYQLDKEGIFLQSEGKGLASLGLKPGEVVGESIFTVYQHYPEILDAFNNTLAGNHSQFKVLVNGMVYESYMEPVFDQNNQITSIIGVSVDLTNQYQSESNLKSLLDNSEDRIWSINKEYKLLTGNAIFQEHVLATIGRKFEIGESVFPPNLPDHHLITWKGYWDRAFSGERFVVEITSNALKKEVSIEYHFGPLVNSEGEIIGGLVTGHDVTNRKKAEERLQEQEEELSVIFENSPILMIVVDQERRIRKFNNMTLESGQKLDIGNIGERFGNALNCINAMDSPEGCGFGEHCQHCHIRNTIHETMETGESKYQVEISMPVHASNKLTELNLLLSTIRFQIRNQPMVLISIIDVSERKKADQQLLKERFLLRTLIDNLPDRIFFKDQNSRFVIANEGVAKHIGINGTDELIGKSDFDFYPPEYAAEYYRNEQDLLKSGEPLLNHEEIARDSNGIDGWTLTSKIPVKDSNGNAFGFVGINRDITNLKKANEELIAAKNLAEKSNLLKDAFIANISHEIRTPLNSIMGFTDLIKESFTPYNNKETEKYFDIIEQSSYRLMRTVDMVLSMSRLQIGEMTIKPKSIDLKALVASLILQYSIVAEKKSIHLVFNAINEDFNLISDEYCLSHSISNLMDNAIKYTKNGFVKVSLNRLQNLRLRLIVEDSGIGISEDYLSHMFNPFSQEDPGISRAYEGIGLGLSLTKRLLDSINAEIQVESIRGVGSTFTLLFPPSIEQNG
jgi:PAS domain S-box-containing protein